jgi:hypothetical protein
MPRFAPFLLAVLALAAACTDEDVTANDIVGAVPWEGPETAKYIVFDNDDEEAVGSLTMTIEPGPAITTLRQYFEFPDAGFVNDAAVVVDSTTLQPRETHFQIEGPEGDLVCDAQYTAGEVTAHRVGEDGERDDTLDIPHTVYDSWSDLFVWRTLPFAEGYAAEYADVLSCTLDRTQLIGVGLSVREMEEAEVPAGAFDAWRMEIDSGGDTQHAWYSADEAHLLLRYDNGEVTFELLEVSAPVIRR